jgi:NAD(P)-dependent dehydrogenase (short-subunit alcohol dehydrogenase family)
MDCRLDGKVAIVTAAAQGIGAASARIMAERGAIVVLADLNESLAKETAAAITKAGGIASGVALDARSEKSVRTMIEYTHRTYGRLDVLHNNAGGSYPERDRLVVDTSQDLWDEVFAWNMGSTNWGCRYAIPFMIAGGGGSIINTVSTAAAFAQSTQTAYGAAKGAVASYTRYVAVQYGRQNIRCNGIAPGLILTPHATQVVPETARITLFKHTTTPRLGKPEDIGNLAAFLASEAAGYINGQVITVDGGLSARFPQDAEMVEMNGYT